MNKILISCLDCSCDFILEHEMDEERYTVQYCPFCGYEIMEDDLQFIDIEEEFE